MPPHEIVLTHADLSPRNIIVKGDKVVGILDWEMAGFYPEYWKYVKAMYHPDWQSRWITDGTLDVILKPFYLEHAVMLHMQEVVW
jgi:thiamine kinase-like enzyme